MENVKKHEKPDRSCNQTNENSEKVKMLYKKNKNDECL